MPMLSFCEYYTKSKDEIYESIWINESFKTAHETFNRDNDPAEVTNVLNQFKALSQQGKIKPEDKDITKWMRKPFSELRDFVQQSSKVKSGKETKSGAKKDSIKLGQYGDWTVIVPLSEPASCYYGKGTKWCTAARDLSHFNGYFSNGVTLVYFINRKENDKLAMAVPSKETDEIECFDARDNSIFLKDISEETGIDRTTLDSIITNARNHEEVKGHRHATFHKKFVDAYNELIPEAESYLTDTDKIYNDIHSAQALSTQLYNRLNIQGSYAALGADRYGNFTRLFHGLDAAIILNRFAHLIMNNFTSNYYSLYDYKQVLAKIMAIRGYDKYLSPNIRDNLVNNLNILKQKQEKSA